MENHFYTFDEVLQVLGISETKLRGAISEGYIRAYRQEAQMIFKKEEVHKIKNEGFDDDPRIVHALQHGEPLCGFSSEVPRDWPPGHSWRYVHEREAITCKECKEVLVALPQKS